MAGARLNVEAAGISGVLEMFNRLIQLGGDASAPLKDVGEYYLRRTEERFNREMAPGGARWKELAPSTRAAKRHAKILTETQRLRGGFTYSVDPKSLEFGTNVIYGAIHQFGGETGRGHKVSIPPRPYLGADAEDVEETTAIFREHLERSAKG